MFSNIFFLCLGLLGGGIITYFVAKNNKEKAIRIIMNDANTVVDELLNSTNADEKVKDLVVKLKMMLNK